MSAPEPMDELTVFVGLSAEIVSAYVAKNHVQTSELPQLIASVHDANSRKWQSLRRSPRSMSRRCPSTRRSDPTDIISLEDGRRYKSLKRHLSSRGLTPEQYRKKLGSTSRLPDGRGQLRQGSVRVGEGNWSRPKGEGP